MPDIEIEELTQAAFAPFGDVLTTGRSDHPTYPINDGYTQRFHALSPVSVQGEAAILSIFETESFGLPLQIKMLERHPKGSQAFMPIGDKALQDFYVVVATGEPAPARAGLRAFRVGPGQGVNIHPGVWHHPNIVSQGRQRFLVVDRADPASNLEEYVFPADWAAVWLRP